MGAYLDKPITTKHSEDGAQGCFSYGSSGMQGWRTKMEDTHVNELNVEGDSGAALFAVFDGHGGSEVALFSKKHISPALRETAQFKEGEYAKGLERSFFQLDEMILADYPDCLKTCLQEAGESNFGHLRPDPHGDACAGCTATACFIKDRKIHIANAGDSRIVLCQGGKAIDLSEDHKPELDSERDRIVKAGGYITEGRVNGNLNLTRAVGDFTYKKDKSLQPAEQIITVAPDISSQDLLESDEFLILGCDGVWDRKTSQEVVDFVKPRLDSKPKDKPLSAIVEELLDDLISPNVGAYDGLGCDNMTCVIVDLVADKRNADGSLPDASKASSSPSSAPLANPKAMAGNRRPTTVFDEDGAELAESLEKAKAESETETKEDA